MAFDLDKYGSNLGVFSKKAEAKPTIDISQVGTPEGLYKYVKEKIIDIKLDSKKPKNPHPFIRKAITGSNEGKYGALMRVLQKPLYWSVEKTDDTVTVSKCDDQGNVSEWEVRNVLLVKDGMFFDTAEDAHSFLKDLVDAESYDGLNKQGQEWFSYRAGALKKLIETEKPSTKNLVRKLWADSKERLDNNLLKDISVMPDMVKDFDPETKSEILKMKTSLKGKAESMLGYSRDVRLDA